MKKSEDVQLPLFSNAEFSSSIPSRATSKQENDFIVIIRNEIQNFVKNGGDYSKPIVLNIDLKKIASERGLSRWEPLQRSFKKTIDTIKQYPLNQTIQYLDEDNNLRERTYANGPTGCCHTSTRTPSRASSRSSSIRTSKSTT
jgi:hypothetical protein